MKKILVACGTGIATSTMVVNKLRNKLTQRGKISNVNISQCTVAELKSKADNFDLIVVTTKVSFTVKTPMILGIPLLTGVGEDKVLDEIISVLGL